MTRTRAFTLIELLVSVAIIALLIGIAMPSISEARRISKTTRCQHNLHQIGIGIEAYLNVHKDYFPTLCRMQSIEPPIAASLGIPPRPSLARGLAKEFGRNSKVFECPADLVTEIDDTTRNLIISTGSKLGLGKRYFDTEDTSYDWTTQVNGIHRRQKTVPMFEGSIPLPLKDVPIVFDYEPFHGGRRRVRSTNNLYADLRVVATPSKITMTTGS
ncbi:MAG: type II secretion system protein [Phycisphaerae bacterium]|jgi:prepilin-type N-terminal cleavage/methylation domain-containing protein